MGDYISRTMLIRVEYWERILQRFWVRCHAALQDSGQEGGDLWNAVERVRAELHEKVDRLKIVCFTGSEARVRDACIALLQVFGAYRRRADLTWLGLPSESVQLAACDIPHRVKHRRDASVAEQIAAALTEFAGMYRRPFEPEELIEQKRQSHALVLVMGRGSRAVYWRDDLVAQDWSVHATPWDLLCVLAEQSKTGQGVDWVLWRDRHDRGPLKDRRYRLKKLIPADLNQKIKSAGQGTYQLDLRPEEICLLHYEDNERLVELTKPVNLDSFSE